MDPNATKPYKLHCVFQFNGGHKHIVKKLYSNVADAYNNLYNIKQNGYALSTGMVLFPDKYFITKTEILHSE